MGNFRYNWVSINSKRQSSLFVTHNNFKMFAILHKFRVQKAQVLWVYYLYSNYIAYGARSPQKLFSEWKSATNWTAIQTNWLCYSNRRSKRCVMRKILPFIIGVLLIFPFRLSNNRAYFRLVASSSKISPMSPLITCSALRCPVFRYARIRSQFL